jgi:thiol peroxidase
METTKLKGNTVQLTGQQKNVGDFAPEAKVIKNDLTEKVIGGAKGVTQIIAFVPSLDTEVCATETRKFNQKIAELGNVDFTIVSMDLPFAQSRFCSTEGIDKIDVTSDFKNKEATEKYGMLLADGPLAGLSARAIFVIDKDGNITYKEIVPEITEEPDYDKVLNFVKSL